MIRAKTLELEHPSNLPSPSLPTTETRCVPRLSPWAKRFAGMGSAAWRASSRFCIGLRAAASQSASEHVQRRLG
jgi:hypothetical protein